MITEATPPTLAEIREARSLLGDRIRETPVWRWRGREISYSIGPQKFTKLADVAATVKDLVANPSTAKTPFLMRPGNTVTNAELLGLARMLNDAGVAKVYLRREPE